MMSITGHIAKALAAQSPKLVTLVRITDQDSNDHYFSSGARAVTSSSTYIDYVQNVAAVSPVSTQIDPITRRSEGSAVTVTLHDDGAIRHIMATQPLKNAKVTIRLTTEDDNAGSSVGYWAGIIEDVLPRDGLIDLVCLDALAHVYGKKYFGLLMNRHPLELVETLLDAKGIPSGLLDSTSLDPDTDTAISHFVCNCRWTPTYINAIGAVDIAGTIEGTDDASGAVVVVGSDDMAWLPSLVTQAVAEIQAAASTSQLAPSIDVGETVSAVALMCYGTIAPDEDGKISFRRFDSTAAVSATWTSNDIVSLTQVGTYENLINEIEVPLKSGQQQESYIYRDTASQAKHEIPGATTHVRRVVIDLPLACQETWLAAAVTDVTTTGTDFVLSHVRLSGLCGTRVADAFRSVSAATAWGAVSPFTQVAASGLSSARKFYLKLDGEIISVDSFNGFEVDCYWDLLDVDGNGEVLTTHSFYPTRLKLGGTVTRAVGGAAAAHTPYVDHGSPFFDVTIPRYVAVAIVTRCANGLPRLAVETTLAQYAMELGDLVAVEDTTPLLWGEDGLDSANVVKWEIVGKEIDLERGTIRWDLAFAAIATPPWSTTYVDDPIDPVFNPDANGAPNIATSLAVNQNIGSKTWTVVGYDTTDWAAGLTYDLTNDWVIVGRDGAYEIHAQVTVIDLAAAGYCQCGIYTTLPGGSSTAAHYGPQVYNDSAGVRDMACTVDAPNQYLQAGEKVQIKAWNDGAATSISGDPAYTWMTIRFIG